MIHDTETIARMSYEDVMAVLAKMRCACRSCDDAALCARLRWGQAEWEAETEAMGAVARCECECHEIWHAWVEGNDDE